MQKSQTVSTPFKYIFGIEAQDIKDICVITPFYYKEMLDIFKTNLNSKGILYKTFNNDNLSFIITKMGAGFVGDAVLYLEQTNCKKLIFLGICGAIKENNELKLGSNVLIKKAYCQDSFVNLLENKTINGIYYPDSYFYNEIIKKNITRFVKGSCLSVASIKLEDVYIKNLRLNDIDVVDMETSPFLAAAKHIKKQAISILCVTDIFYTNPYYITFLNKHNIKNSILDLFESIKDFID